MSRMDDIEDGAASAEIHDLMAARMTKTSPVLEEALRYWTSKRTGGDLPARDDLDPRAMQLIIGHSMILDRVRPGTVRVRVGGRIPNALMGMETRGLPVRAFFDLLQRGEAADLIETAFTAPATVEVEMVSDGDDGPVSARLLILPLLDRDGAVSKALAVIVPDRLVTDGPRRFRMLRHSLGTIALPAVPPTPDQAVLVMEPPSAAPSGQAWRPRPDAPYLRVVK